MLRKLVTIQEVKELIPIKDADNIELAKIMGWQCVVKKGEFKKGDKAVYFEVDSFLPIEEKYEFLRTSSYRNNPYIGEGFRIRTMKLRGELSQGLLLPFNVFDNEEELKKLNIGDDVTKLLNVQKWIMPEVEDASGTVIGNKPFGIPTTDELRIQSTEIFIEKLTGKSYYISTKMDGTSCTMYHKDGRVGITGRNDEFKDDGKSSFWEYAHKHNIPEKLKAYGKNIAIQGEFCGHGIQGNPLKLLKPKFFVFDIVDLDDKNSYYSFDDLVATVEELGLELVPIEEVGESFNYSMEELLEKAKGKYPSGKHKEGIVVRSKIPEYVLEVYSKLSFKVLNNDFLLKEK